MAPTAKAYCMKLKKKVIMEITDVVLTGRNGKTYAFKGKSKECPHEMMLFTKKEEAEKVAKELGIQIKLAPKKAKK